MISSSRAWIGAIALAIVAALATAPAAFGA